MAYAGEGVTRYDAITEQFARKSRVTKLSDRFDRVLKLDSGEGYSARRRHIAVRWSAEFNS